MKTEVTYLIGNSKRPKSSISKFVNNLMHFARNV